MTAGTSCAGHNRALFALKPQTLLRPLFLLHDFNAAMIFVTFAFLASAFKHNKASNSPGTQTRMVPLNADIL